MQSGSTSSRQCMRGHRCHSSLSMPACFSSAQLQVGWWCGFRPSSSPPISHLWLLSCSQAVPFIILLLQAMGERKGKPIHETRNRSSRCMQHTGSLVFVPTVLGRETAIGERSPSPKC